MATEALRCKECGRRTRSTRAMCASAASGRSRSPTTSPTSTPSQARRKIQAGSRGIWRYADFLPVRGSARASALEPGLTPLVRADRLAEQLGLGEVWIKNDAANPTHSFKDRVVAVALAKARELGFDTVACASTGNLANAVAAHAAAAGLAPTSSSPPTSRSRSCSRPASTARTLVGVNGNYDDVNRLCTAALRGARRGRSSTSTCAPTTPRARRRSPTRPPSSSAGRSPTASSARSRRARCSRSSAAASTSGSSSAWSRASCRRSTAPRRGLQPGRDRVRRRRRRLPAGQPDTIAKSLAIGNPADGALRARPRARAPAARSSRSPTTRSATASACSPRRPGSSPRPPAA